MHPVLRFILEKFASPLPPRYRGWIHIGASSAFTSGLSQVVFFLGLFIYGYLVFISTTVFGGTSIGIKAVELGGETALMGSGIFVLMEYMIQPLTLVLVYFAFEGFVRAAAAFVSAEVIPTLPLVLVAWMHGKLEELRAEQTLGKRVPDVVESVDSEDIKLIVRSCRQKPSWDHRVTVFYNDVLYEVAGENLADPPHTFVYSLRHRPASKLIRGTHHYDPNEVLVKN